MVGGDGIAEDRQRLGLDNVRDRRRGHAQPLEIGWIGDIGRSRAPLIGVRSGNVDRLPMRVALIDIGIARLEHRPVDRARDGGRDLVVGRPDVLEIHVVTRRADADRRGQEILDHRALERIGDHQRRRREEVGAHVRRHAPFEIAVARNHGGGDQPIFIDRSADRGRQRPRIADAGGAAIAHQIETDGVQMRLQPRLFQIIGHDLATRRQRRLHPWLGLQAQLVRLLGDQPSRDQHAGVRRIGAAGDRRDGDVAVANVEILAFHRHAGLCLLVGIDHVGIEHIIDVGQRDPVLRPLRPGQAGHDGGQIQFQRVGEHRFDRRVDPETLFLGIGLDQRDRLVRATGQAHIVQRLVIDAEEAAGRAIFRRHIGKRSPIGEAQRRQTRSEIFDETPHHATRAQHLGAGQHQVGGGHAFLQRTGKFEAHDFGDQHRYRLAQHRGLRLDPAHAPTQYAQAIDHRGVAVGADAGVGIGDGGAAFIDRRPHALRDILQIDLMADARARRHGVEIGEALAAPFQEVVALHIALIFDLHILLERLGRAELIDHDAMVYDEVDGHLRIDLAGVGAQRVHRVAHRGQIDHAGHTGKILQQHARGAILDFPLGLAPVILPIDDRLDILGGHGHAIFETEQIFQQHLHRKRQARYVAQLLRGLLQRIIGNVLAADIQCVARAQSVLSDGGHKMCVSSHGLGQRRARFHQRLAGWQGGKDTPQPMVEADMSRCCAAITFDRFKSNGDAVCGAYVGIRFTPLNVASPEKGRQSWTQVFRPSKPA